MKAKEKLMKDEIEFEDEIIVDCDSKEINAYISTENINLNKKFGLKYADDSYYDMYLNYKYLEGKTYIKIICVKAEERKSYIYTPNIEEQKMLIEKLKAYVKKVYKQNIKDFIKEIEEWEKE